MASNGSDSVGNPTLSGDYHYGLRAMTSGIGINPITNVVEGQVNVHHYIPTPNTIPESGFKPDRIIDLNHPSDCSTSNLYYMFSNAARYDDGPSPSKKRRMHRIPFNSSVLGSNHQIAAEPLQNSYLSTDFLLLPSGIDAGESDKQDKSGLDHEFVPPSSGVQNQVADINIHNDEHPIHFDEWIEMKLPVPAGSFDWYDDEVYQLIHPLLVKPITEDLKNLLDQMKADLEERFVKGSDES